MAESSKSELENSDSFVIDMKTFCHEDAPPNSRIIPRKGSQKIGSGSSHSTSSPRAAAAAVTEASLQVYETNINGSSEGRAIPKRNSLRRSSAWCLDPRRILILFASLSSIGTMILIYFTLSITSKADDNGLD